MEGSRAGLEASWAVLGIPGRFLLHLGPFWRRLGGVFDRSWRPLGRSGAEKGGQHGSKVAPKRSQNQLKIDPEIDQFVSASLNRFWKDLGSQNGSIVDQFWLKKSIKNQGRILI